MVAQNYLFTLKNKYFLFWQSKSSISESRVMTTVFISANALRARLRVFILSVVF